MWSKRDGWVRVAPKTKKKKLKKNKESVCHKVHTKWE